MTETGEQSALLANKSLDELAAELALLPEGSAQAERYHDEIIRRQEQADLDSATFALVTEKTKYSKWAIVILGTAIAALVASMLLQK